MREEVGGSVGLSVLSLRLVPWRIRVLLELASVISLVINFFRFVTLLSALIYSP